MYVYKVVVGVDLINELLRKSVHFSEFNHKISDVFRFSYLKVPTHDKKIFSNFLHSDKAVEETVV